MEATIESEHIARTKKAELLSSVGAGVLGAGIALLFANLLAPYAVAILLVGLLAHSWGMFQKHWLEKQAESVRLWWAEALYWFAGWPWAGCYWSSWQVNCRCAPSRIAERLNQARTWKPCPLLYHS